MQYAALLKVDNIDLKFTEDAIREMAKIAYYENENKETSARAGCTPLWKCSSRISAFASGEHEMVEGS